MRDKFFEFTGTISSAASTGHEMYFVISGEDGNHRMFSGLGIDGKQLSYENDEERHERYDLGMDTNMVFTVNEFGQYIISYRWKIMRQFPELVRYVVDQAKRSDFRDGGLQDGIVFLHGLESIVSFDITDEIVDAVFESLKVHPNIIHVERNGRYFKFVAKFR